MAQLQRTGAAAGGMVAGAYVGSVFPVVGTALGAALGSLLGGTLFGGSTKIPLKMPGPAVLGDKINCAIVCQFAAPGQCNPGDGRCYAGPDGTTYRLDNQNELVVTGGPYANMRAPYAATVRSAQPSSAPGLSLPSLGLSSTTLILIVFAAGALILLTR